MRSDAIRQTWSLEASVVAVLDLIVSTDGSGISSDRRCPQTRNGCWITAWHGRMSPLLIPDLSLSIRTISPSRAPSNGCLHRLLFARSENVRAVGEAASDADTRLSVMLAWEKTYYLEPEGRPWPSHLQWLSYRSSLSTTSTALRLM